MQRSRQRLSIFSLTTDRGAALAYFLGAVPPFVLLAAVLGRFVWASSVPTPDRLSVFSADWMLPLFGALGALSLASFLMLRRFVAVAVAENRALACYDRLTGLPNRRLYTQRLEQSLLLTQREERLAAVCCLDLDGFGRINAALGRDGGDRLLCQVGERLVGSLRSSDSVARLDREGVGPAVSRLGGDQFTFLLTGIEDGQDSRRAAHRVLRTLRSPFPVEGGGVSVTASIGIAIFPFDGADAGTLLEHAGVAMRRAKERGGDDYQFYSPSMNEDAGRKRDLENRLRGAIRSDALSLCFQPIFEAGANRIVGAEASIRWADSEIACVAAAEFVSIAEDCGLMPVLGRWALRAACGQAGMWREGGDRPLRIVVRTSDAQLRQPGFPGVVEQALEEAGLNSSQLELEIGESALGQSDPVTAGALRRLREMGVGIALGGFGGGEVSLSVLACLPAARIALDQQLASKVGRDEEASALAEVVAGVARALGLKLVAKGVETPEQADRLRALGCDELQGRLFGEDLPANELARLLGPPKTD